MVIDNEAGMEHISRLTTNNIDLLIIVSDASKRGIHSAERILELTDELGLNIDRKVFVVNQVKDGLKETVEKMVHETPLELIGIISGRPTIELDEASKALQAAFMIFDKIIKG